MQLEGRVRTGGGTLREFQAHGADYDTAKAALEAQVGDGEQLLSIRRLDG